MAEYLLDKKKYVIKMVGPLKLFLVQGHLAQLHQVECNDASEADKAFKEVGIIRYLKKKKLLTCTGDIRKPWDNLNSCIALEYWGALYTRKMQRECYVHWLCFTGIPPHRHTSSQAYLLHMPKLTIPPCLTDRCLLHPLIFIFSSMHRCRLFKY